MGNNLILGYSLLFCTFLIIHMALCDIYQNTLPVIRRQKEELEATNFKTGKLLTLQKWFHPKYSTLRLFNNNEGGQGLVSVRSTVQDETTKIQKYIRRMVPDEDELLSECLR